MAIPVLQAQVISDSTAVRPDSVQVLPDSLGPSIGFPGDSIPIGLGEGDSLAGPVSPQQKYVDSLKATSDLTAPVKYSAQDSIIFDVENGILYLHEQSSLDYDDIQLQAKLVEVEIDNQTLHARGVEDSLGNYEGQPQFTQGGESYQAKTMSYNFKSQKGRITEGRLAEGEGFIIAPVAKYQDDGSFHGAGGKYTTCDAEHPHFYIQSRKLKVLPDDKLVSGPLNLVVAGFPIPIIIPFGFIPNFDQKGQKKRFGPPPIWAVPGSGIFLQNMGYYLGVNEYMDLRFDADIYTRGGWRASVATNYRIKYKFNGNLKFQYGVQRFNEKTDPDFRRTAAWSLTWSHSQPIDPTARLSASVNISSSNSFQREISYRQSDFFTNNLNSSVSFQKRFNNLPISFNLSARHQQDLNKETMSMQLPEFSMNVNRQTPFKNINNKAFNFLKQLGVTYNMQARNSLQNIPDSLFGTILLRPRDSVIVNVIENGDTIPTKRVASSFYTNGAKHTATASTQIKLFKYVNIAPSFNYSEFWYTQTLEKVWNPETQRIDDQTNTGFTRGYNFNTSVSATTNFYGIYQFKGDKGLAIRQRFSPSVAYSLKPDFADPSYGFYKQVQRDTTGDNFQTYSIFERGIYGGPTRGESQSLSFSLSSVLEMKYKKKQDPDEEVDEKADEFVRTNLVDNLGISTSYNFAADSFQLAPFSLRARTRLFKGKVSLNTSASLDPYVFASDPVVIPNAQSNPRRQNRFLINETGQLGRITRAQVSFNTSFQSKRKKGNKKKSEDFDEVVYNEVLNTYYQYVDFDIPWSLRFSYSLSYSKPGLDAPRVTQTINTSGDVNFTPNWKIGFNSGYDLQNFKVTNTSINIYRLLHCWEMSFQWIPFGPLKSYSLTLNVRSSTLKDLRLTRRNSWQDRFRP